MYAVFAAKRTLFTKCQESMTDAAEEPLWGRWVCQLELRLRARNRERRPTRSPAITCGCFGCRAADRRGGVAGYHPPWVGASGRIESICPHLSDPAA